MFNKAINELGDKIKNNATTEEIVAGYKVIRTLFDQESRKLEEESGIATLIANAATAIEKTSKNELEHCEDLNIIFDNLFNVSSKCASIEDILATYTDIDIKSDSYTVAYSTALHFKKELCIYDVIQKRP